MIYYVSLWDNPSGASSKIQTPKQQVICRHNSMLNALLGRRASAGSVTSVPKRFTKLLVSDLPYHLEPHVLGTHSTVGGCVCSYHQEMPS